MTGIKLVRYYMKGDSWNKLVPELKEKALSFLDDAISQGYDILFYSGYRTIEQEQEEMKKGASKVSDPLNSYHLWGMAFDIAFHETDTQIGQPDKNDSRWQEIEKIANKHGLIIPITWDKPHIQLAGVKLADIRKQYNNPDDYLTEKGVA